MGIFKSNKEKTSKLKEPMKNNITIKEGFRVIEEDRVVGKHLMANFYNTDKLAISNREFVKKILEEALYEGNIGFTDINVWPQSTSKSCTTMLGVLQEGHVALHTWISYKYATVDIFITGSTANPEKSIQYLIKNFRPEKHEIFTVDRTQKRV